MANTTIVKQGKAAVTEWDAANQGALDSRVYTGDSALADKKLLAGREFIIVVVRKNRSDKVQRADENGLIVPATYLSASCVVREAVTVEGEALNRVVFNDGGSGIEPVVRRHIENTDPDALQAYDSFETVDLNTPLHCRHGLRPSEYTAKLPDGSTTAATTWYIA